MLLENALKWVAGLDFPILYCAVDKEKLAARIEASASPIDIAFRLYLESL